jgi:hypothetical protein
MKRFGAGRKQATATALGKHPQRQRRQHPEKKKGHALALLCRLHAGGNAHKNVPLLGGGQEPFSLWRSAEASPRRLRAVWRVQIGALSVPGRRELSRRVLRGEREAEGARDIDRYKPKQKGLILLFSFLAYLEHPFSFSSLSPIMPAGETWATRPLLSGTREERRCLRLEPLFLDSGDMLLPASFPPQGLGARYAYPTHMDKRHP